MTDVLLILLISFLFPFYVGIVSICFHVGKVYAVRFVIGKNKNKRGNENAEKE